MLCILLGIAGTFVYAASAMLEDNTTVTEKPTHELVPVMARGCCDNSSWYNEDGSRNYPLNYGFAGSYLVTTLSAGTILAYYGAAMSGYFCLPGTAASTISLTPVEYSTFA